MRQWAWHVQRPWDPLRWECLRVKARTEEVRARLVDRSPGAVLWALWDMRGIHGGLTEATSNLVLSPHPPQATS